MIERDRVPGGQWRRFVPAGYSLVLALLIAGPLLGRGYLLLRDGVSTPRSYLTDSALGLGDAAPRAVPQDALLAAVSTVVDGGIAVKAILVAALWAAGAGAAVLARRTLSVSTGPQLVAATVAVWNPYVAERLLQGHWSLLTGYAALPWTVVLAQRIRAASPASGVRHRVTDWAMLGGCLAAAALTPTGALLAGFVTLVVFGQRGVAAEKWRNIGAALVLWCAVSAPWLVATVLSGSGAEPSDPAGIGAFAARAEPGLATLGSLAGLGGIWNADAVPASRATLAALAATAVLLVAVAAGVRGALTAGDDETRPIRRALLALAAVAIVLPALGATGWGMQVGEFLVTRIPGAGLLRDTQKYVALAMPAFALCAAAGCRAIASVGHRRADPGITSPADASETPSHTTAPATTDLPSAASGTALPAAFLVAALLLTLPDLAWGVGGALQPVRYPSGWQAVAARITDPGDVAVLPAGMFRKFPDTGRAPVLDPAPRMLPRDVLQTGELPVRGRMVAGEGARAGAVEQVLLDGGGARELAARDVGWVLVERATPGQLGNSATTLAQLQPVYSDAELALYRVPGATDSPEQPLHRGITLAAHLVWALFLLGGPTALLVRRIRRYRTEPRAVRTS